MPKNSSLLILSLSATLLMVGVGMIVALLPQRVHAMTNTLASVGLIASVFALAYLAGQLPVGILADRVGAKWFLVTGYMVCALSGLVFLTARTTGGIYAGRALQGLGEAPIWALGPAVLSLAYPAVKGRAIGIYNAAIHMGLTLGPILGLLVAPDGRGDWPFLIFSILSFAGGLLVLVSLRAGPASGCAPKASVHDVLVLLRQRNPAILLVGILFYGAGYGLFVSVLPISLTLTHGFDSRAVSLLFVLFYAAVSLSQIVAGSVSDRIGRCGFLVWGMALSAAGFMALSALPGLWAFVPLAVASVGLGAFCVASIAALHECVPDALKGGASGGYYFFWGAGYMLGPLVIGAAASRDSLVAYLCLSGAFLVQAVILHFTWKKQPQT